MKKIAFYLSLLLCQQSCSKSEFLNAKPDQSDMVPTTISDFQAILDQDRDINGMGTTGRGPVPYLGEVGADNYYVSDADFNTTLRVQFQNYYIWEDGLTEGNTEQNWNWPYQTVFYTNVVLDGLAQLSTTSDDIEAYNEALGNALFVRSHAFYQLAQVFCAPYDVESADSDPGIPLRLSSDVNEVLSRASVQHVYDRVLADLNKAVNLLGTAPLVKTRASKQAAYALLARVHQSMQNHEEALRYADSCLQLHPHLLDYNDLNTDIPYAFVGGASQNPEVIYDCNMVGALALNNPIRNTFALVDTLLYATYDDEDLRKSIYYKATAAGHSYNGSYNGNNIKFAGLAADEIYLIRAESFARQGNITAAMADLNRLMSNRWKHASFKAFEASTNEDALSIILEERRKELVFRGLRWTDLRRLNKEGRHIVVNRHVNGKVHQLLPNSINYVWPIPPEVISFYPDMPQNRR